MKRFRHLLFSLGCLSLVTLTLAAGTTAHLSWSAPTTYNDTSPLPATDIDHYTLTWAPPTGQPGPSGSVNVPGTATTATAPIPCGNTTFTLSVTTTATAKYPNATSAPTSPIPYASNISCTPNPPTGLVAQ